MVSLWCKIHNEMKKLLLIGAVTVLLAGLASIGVIYGYKPQPIQTKVVKSERLITIPPTTHYVNDTQTEGNISMTLQSVYAPATPLTAMDEVDPSLMLVAIQLKTNVSQTDLKNLSLVYTSDGAYIKPLGGNVKECSSDCVVFIAPRNVLIDTFIYKDFKWFL